MKKAKRSDLVFGLEYVQDIAPEKAQARRVADMWRLYLECRPVTNQLRETLQVDAANDLALLKAVERFASLPISPSRTAQLGSTVVTIGFPNIGLQGFAGLLTTKRELHEN